MTGTTTNYTYEGDRLTAIGSTAITYDALGNPLTYGTFTFTWQNGRQLARVGYVGSSTEYLYEYNDSGIRTSKTVNGIKHDYSLNGSQIVTESWIQNGVEYFIVYLYDESGAPIGMQYRTSEYAWREFDNYYFEKNLFGDVVAIYNEAGTKIGSYKYDAWGVCNASVESTASTFEQNIVKDYNPFRYRGYYYDTETEFYYLQSRYYDPVTGRFLNADGYVNANGDLIGYNMYAYCSNNPVMYVDPTGNWWEDFSEQIGDAWDKAKTTITEYWVETTATISETAYDIYYNATKWHFEDRIEANGEHPTYSEVSNNADWRLLHPDESKFHDDGIGNNELKYVHMDGREAVFNGDSFEPMTDPRYMATFNYVVIVEKPSTPFCISSRESWNEWSNYCYSYVGHGILDVAPYLLLGSCNTREQFENKIIN